MDDLKNTKLNSHMGRKTLVLFYHELILKEKVKPKGAAYRRMIAIQRSDKVQAQWLNVNKDIEDEV
tara:strand:+ start:4781 stop:4978 length:198 start_codon:yes stop_codon:yes gene_type:complete